MTTVLDAFDRTNSTTSLGTATDGATWTVDSGGVAGILSNAAYFTTAALNGRARRDLGSKVQDVTFILGSVAPNTGFGYLWFFYDPVGNSGYYLKVNSSSGLMTLFQRDSGVDTNLGDIGGIGNWQGATVMLRIIYDNAGTILFYKNGAFLTNYIDGSPPAGGTWVGFSAADTYANTGMTWSICLAVDTLPLIDTFNRADDATTLGTTSDGQAVWTPLGGSTWGITGNAAYAPSGNGSLVAVETGMSDGVYQLKPHAFSSFASFAFRLVDANNYWTIATATTSGSVHHRIAGSDPGAIDPGFAFTAGTDIINLLLGGSYIGLCINGVEQWSTTDTTFQTATKHGMSVGNEFNTFDEFMVPFSAPKLQIPSRIVVPPLAVTQRVSGW